MTNISSAISVTDRNLGINCTKTEHVTYRVNPTGGQSICIEYLTGYMDVKVTVKLHFCSGGKRFHLRVSKDPYQKQIDHETMVSPIDIKYAREKRTNKFYVSINFQNTCLVNITSEIRLLPKHYILSRKDPENMGGLLKHDDPTSKNYHTNLIYELEKMDILPPGLQSDLDQVAKSSNYRTAGTSSLTTNEQYRATDTIARTNYSTSTRQSAIESPALASNGHATTSSSVTSSKASLSDASSKT